MKRREFIGIAAAGAASVVGAAAEKMPASLAHLSLDYDSPTDAALQSRVSAVDVGLRERFGMTEEHTAVGVFDLKAGRLALLRPDRIEYAASVPKIAILLAYFHAHPEAASNLEAATRNELGLMIKVSDNAMATKHSQALGLKRIQEILNAHGFYDAQRGGGIWMGKHYGKGGERVVDPVGGHSHGATVRQLVRFYLLLEQGKLVSPAASKTMREIFVSPEIAHREDKFVRGLAGRDLQILRKAGWWETWQHDSAIVVGADRHYIIVALTHHAKGDDYVVALAPAVDELMQYGAR